MSANMESRLVGGPLLKLAVLGLLVILLLVPMGMVTGLVRERKARASGVVAEVSATWGGRQTLTGPVVSIPYRLAEQSDGRTVWKQHRAYFLPARVRWTATLEPEKRSRGIFEVVVYRARLSAEGSFAPPDLSLLTSEGARIAWDQATAVIGIPDVRGVSERASLRWGSSEVPFEPGTGTTDLLDRGLHAPLPGLSSADDAPVAFAFDLVLRGSDNLSFVPVGEENLVQARSSWPSPSFDGAFLPTSHTIRDDGFEARWQVPYFGRSYPQHWTSQTEALEGFQCRLSESAFGLSLFVPADGYQKTERSVKYAVLFILLTFLTFFLTEVWSPVRFHPVQYLLVGFALCLFYLLLLALCEHLGFGVAYASAASATVVLITAYGRSLLRAVPRVAALFACLAGLYAYLYVLLRAEDYALLMGAVGLFAILALVMFVTRRLDWYRLRSGAPARAAGAQRVAGPA